MKKTIYLLLIAISFAACKKDDGSPKDDEKTIKEVWEKEVWKTEKYEVNYYDAGGNLIDSKYGKYPYTVIFEGKEKNGIYIYDDAYLDAETFRYEYKNNNLEIKLIKNENARFPEKTKSEKYQIKEVTDNSMVWIEEYGKETNYITKPDGTLEKKEAEKVVVITTFSKVKRSGETSIKGIWKAEGYDRNYYDAEGKLMYSDFLKEPFAVYIDDKCITNLSKLIINNKETGYYYPDTHTYTYINNIITRKSGWAGGFDFADERQVTELTANSMTWREEFVNNWEDKHVNRKTYETKQGEPEAKPAKAVFKIKFAKVNDL